MKLLDYSLKIDIDSEFLISFGAMSHVLDPLVSDCFLAPINRYRSGCEIRCVNEDCHGPSDRPNVEEKEEQRKMVVGPGGSTMRKSLVLNNVEKVLLERSLELQRKMSQNRMNIRHICRLYRATIGGTKLCKNVVQFIS